MIDGYCICKIQGYSEEKWPRKFVEVPRVGDYIASENNKRLRVQDVTHIGVGHKRYKDGGVNANPLIEIML